MARQSPSKNMFVLTLPLQCEARQRLKEYRENCPQYPARIVMAREKIEKDKN